MRYITFSNKLGQVHKMWADKEGESFICFKVDDINAKADDELEMDLSKPYKMWADKKYKTKEDAETVSVLEPLLKLSFNILEELI